MRANERKRKRYSLCHLPSKHKPRAKHTHRHFCHHHQWMDHYKKRQSANNPSLRWKPRKQSTDRPTNRPTEPSKSWAAMTTTTAYQFFFSPNILLCTLRIIRLFVRFFSAYISLIFHVSIRIFSFDFYSSAPSVSSVFLFCFASISIYLECIFVWAKPAEAAMCVRCRILIQSLPFIFQICVHNNG